MRLIIQAVSSASVKFSSPIREGDSKGGGVITNKIWPGILIYLWISTSDLSDYESKIEKIITKLPAIRFLDGEKSIDQSINSINGETLLIPNFTIYGTNHKGTSMEFTNAASFHKAKEIYEYFVKKALKSWWKLQTGGFWANMQVLSENRGPINYIFEY
jgi:D-tyrosyl-tRNA(Tyr) deacylase